MLEPNAELYHTQPPEPTGDQIRLEVEPEATDFTGALTFNPAWYMDGEMFETEVDMFFEFTLEDGIATGFDVRGLEDRLMMRARREG